MSFDIYRIEPFKEGHWSLTKIGPLALGGPKGLFAQHLPTLVANGPMEWKLPPATLLQWAGIPETAAHGIFFNLTPNSPPQVNLLQLESVTGRTASLLTDLVFHFKIACASRDGKGIVGEPGKWILPGWQDKPCHIEQLRLSGGTKGGTWAWSQAPQAVSATVL